MVLLAIILRGENTLISHMIVSIILYVPKFVKLHHSNSSFVTIASTTCNYYERGRKSYLYASMLFKTQPTDHYMHWLPQNCCYSFIYKMPMHRKRVRLKSRWFKVLWCVPYALTSSSVWANLYILRTCKNNFTYCFLTISLIFSLYIKFGKVNEKDE